MRNVIFKIKPQEFDRIREFVGSVCKELPTKEEDSGVRLFLKERGSEVVVVFARPVSDAALGLVWGALCQEDMKGNGSLCLVDEEELIEALTQ